jgi:hypothetical protein
MLLGELCKNNALKEMILVDEFLKYKQNRVYVPQSKLRLLVSEQYIVVPLPAIEK